MSTVEENIKMLEELKETYEQIISDLEDENNSLRILSNQLEAKVNELEKPKTRKRTVIKK